MGAVDEIEPPIVLFDGVCNLCNGAINFILDHEKTQKLRFAPLQSDFAQQILAKTGLDNQKLDSIVLFEQSGIYQKSSAALRIARYLKQPISSLYYAIYLPSFLRDPFYDLVARYRYQWFGKQEQCRIPSPELKERFIDSPILS